jgi:penicillin-insensitive murein DD-endopeptidase
MNLRLILIPLLASAVVASATLARAQDKGSVDPQPLPPLANPNDPKIGAKQLFGRKLLPASMPTRVIGFYAKGCIAGAEALPINGDTWQVMRLSRNRNWGHPDLIALLERLSAKAHKDGWRGLLVGDMSQPRGGPMITGHASHQVGLDADVWLTPMPDHRLSREEREDTSAVMIVRPDRLDVDSHVWTPAHLAVIRDAALEPRVQRIFVNPAIKKALCREAKGDRGWLSKVRPFWGHDYHFHIRLSCPEGSKQCQSQPAPSESEGCAASDFAYWFKPSVLHPPPPKEPPKPHEGLTLAQLPPDCREVLAAPDARQ